MLIAGIVATSLLLGTRGDSGRAEEWSTAKDGESQGEVEPVPDPSPVPKQPSTLEVDADWDGGGELVEAFIAAESALRNDPQTPFELEDAVAGAALEDLRVEALEFAANGIVQRGSPDLVSATPVRVDVEGEPQSVTVLVCLDYSSVDFLTPDGDQIKDANAQNRVPSIVTLDRLEGRWLVTERAFPEEDEC